MSDAPVGVFDSGVGGLTVLRALTAELPSEHFVYLGDTARLPYGTKSPETVARYALQATDALIDCGVKCIVVACNTASAAALPAIRERAEDVPVIGVIEPGAEAACAASRSGHIAVIATEGTVRGGAYQEAIYRRRGEARVSSCAAQLLVALAEEGLNEGPIAESIVRHYLQPLLHRPTDAAHADTAEAADSSRPAGTRALASGDALPDTLVLGCTHFPMLLGAIGKVAGPGLHIVDSAATTARAARDALVAAGLARAEGPGSVRFLATDGPERFARVGSLFLGRPLTAEQVEIVDL